MKKEERIKRYGGDAFEKQLQQSREWHEKNPERDREHGEHWRAANPEKAEAYNHDISRKGGKYYEQQKQHRMNGIPHEKELVRGKHRRSYRAFKRIIAPDSQIHHDWLNDGTSNYRGVALVEADQHRHGHIDVIQILEGEITLLTEEEIRNRGQVV